MWLFTNSGFISVVQKPDDIDTLTVRARVKGDIARVFPGTKETVGGGTDYAYRAKVPREQVAKAIHDQIMGITYGNFKNSIKSNDHHDLCAHVWSVAYRHQAKNGRKTEQPPTADHLTKEQRHENQTHHPLHPACL